MAWVLVGSGMITLLAAANSRQRAHLCKEVVVSIKGNSEKMFVEENDILQQLKKYVNGPLIEKPVAEVNLSLLEKRLLTNAWIKEAQLYFDSKDVLHVLVTEREPIARVFTTAGGSFYLDTSGKRMPLMEKVSIRLPVVTNFSAAKNWNARDSAVIKDLTTLLQYITKETFWASQVAQIDVRPNGTFELIPVIGNHIIKVGNVENLEEKFHNLFIFYKQVLSKAGFDSYKVIDVQFKGQVIGIKTNPMAAIDSIQLQKNIAALIEKTKAQAASDSLFNEKVNEFLAQKDTSSVKFDAIITNPTPVMAPKAESEKPKTITKPQAVEKPKAPVVAQKSNPKEQQNQKKIEQKPKAVMQKKG